MSYKKNINDLIADWIIEKGINVTSQFDYLIDVEDLEDDFSDDLLKYIDSYRDNIFASIKKDKRVADVYMKEDPIGFDMVFYWEYCLDEKGQEVLKRSESLNVELEYEDIVDIANDLWIYDDDNENRKKYIDDSIINKSKEEDYGL